MCQSEHITVCVGHSDNCRTDKAVRVGTLVLGNVLAQGGSVVEQLEEFATGTAAEVDVGGTDRIQWVTVACNGIIRRCASVHFPNELP